MTISNSENEQITATCTRRNLTVMRSKRTPHDGKRTVRLPSHRAVRKSVRRLGKGVGVAIRRGSCNVLFCDLRGVLGCAHL